MRIQCNMCNVYRCLKQMLDLCKHLSQMFTRCGSAFGGFWVLRHNIRSPLWAPTQPRFYLNFWRLSEWTRLALFYRFFFLPTSYLVETKMSQQKNNQKVACNMSNFSPILVSNISFLLLPTGSPIMKLGQFWPFGPPPDHPKWYLTSKSSPQPSISIFRKSKKKLATFPINFFRGITKVW